MVVKDASGQCHVGNITVIPSGQLWVFMRIYETFFIDLYGKVTVSRNRGLALTDDDQLEHGLFDNSIMTLDHYRKSRHMLCTFHALVKQFHKQIYPLMPHKAGSKLVYCK